MRGKSSSTGRRPPTPPPGPRRKKLKRTPARKKTNVANSLITEQRDFRVDYVAPSKPKYNKSVRKFQTKVMKALQRVHPVVSKIFTNASVQTLTTSNTQQVWQVFHLKGFNGGSATPGSGSLYNEQTQGDIGAGIGANLTAVAGLSNNFTVKYAEMEICCANTQANADVNLDMYVLEYVSKAGNPMNQFATFKAALDAGIAATTSLGTAYDLNAFGHSPFDIVALLRDYGIKVVKKVTFVLRQDDVCTYRHKDYKRHVFDIDSLSTDLTGKYCIPGKTTSVLIVGRPAGSDLISGFRASCIRRYHVQPEYQKADVTYGGAN